MVADRNHRIDDDYSEVIYVEQANDSADFKIGEITQKNDIVVTADFGLASMVLTDDIRVITFNGMIVNSFNIDMLLMQRFISAKNRRSGKKTKGPKKRKNEDDVNFRNKLLEMIDQRLNQDGKYNSPLINHLIERNFCLYIKSRVKYINLG